MKKNLYIHPETMVQPMNFISNICVVSVHGGTLQYGGDASESATPIDPM